MYKNKWPTAVDLFSGCGGVTEALKRRHFRVVAAVDNDPVACATYRANHPKVHLYEDNIESVSPYTIRRDDLGSQDLDLLIVCAPCQPFSSQGRRNATDERIPLIFNSVRFAKALKPKLIFFENVPGLASSRFRKVLSTLKRDLRTIGYMMGDPELIDAADYGVPQRRQRCILLAKKNSMPPRLQSPITPEGMRCTVRDTIGTLERLKSGQRHPVDPLHFAREHQPIALERLFHIPTDGGSRFSLPESLVLPCHKDHSGHPDVYGRMVWDDVSPTLTTGCTDITKGRFAHPEDHRSITLREAARLQTFRDEYIFEGNPSQIATQIGNAVPVKLIDALIPSLRLGVMSSA